jgi:hypothetical protein
MINRRLLTSTATSTHEIRIDDLQFLVPDDVLAERMRLLVDQIGTKGLP